MTSCLISYEAPLRISFVFFSCPIIFNPDSESDISAAATQTTDQAVTSHEQTTPSVTEDASSSEPSNTKSASATGNQALKKR